MMVDPREKSSRQGGHLDQPLWVESNVQKEAARALEMLHAQVMSAVIDPYSWKWVMIVLHHSVQAFVLASLGPAEMPPSEIEPGDSLPELEAHHDPRVLSNVARTDYLPELYERMKQTHDFRPDPAIDRDIARLAAYREVFIQRMPWTWVLPLQELPRSVRNCLKVIDYLGWSPGRIAWCKEGLSELARNKFLVTSQVLDALARQYHSSSTPIRS